MAEARKRLSTAEKKEIIENAKCYVCEDLGLDHAGFDGYEPREVHLDHYQTPHGNVGATSSGAGSDVLPIHAASGGARPEDADYEDSQRRNCHASRGNNFNSRTAYVQVLRARMQARTASYVDDVYENAHRDPTAHEYVLPATWHGSSATFMDKKYAVASDVRSGETWNRFLTTLPANRLFTDDTSQVRQATKKTVHKMIDTYLLEAFPTFAPVNARIDRCGHVVIFDGNHRATSHALAYGVEKKIPVMIWDVQPGTECALRGQAMVAPSTKSGKGGAVYSSSPDAPNTTRLYQVLVRLHDDVRQIQYPYSAKVLKWGIIRESEMLDALKDNPNATEKDVYAGYKPVEVSTRIAGAFTAFIDAEGYREKWKELGLAEGSWKTFLDTYCMMKADPTAVIDSPNYLRDAEMDNLLTLVKVLDEEVFSHPDMKGGTNLNASMKSKWWKECHRVFSEALTTEVYYRMSLTERPKNGACHTSEWPDDLKVAVRGIAKRWRQCPLWERTQSNNPKDGEVDFTSNNEATVKRFLTDNQFTTHYLEGRDN